LIKKYKLIFFLNIYIGYLDLNEDDELYSDLESESESEETQIEKPAQGKGTLKKYILGT